MKSLSQEQINLIKSTLIGIFYVFYITSLWSNLIIAADDKEFAIVMKIFIILPD